jgi:nucleotide-binding universal stress UspA family protein
LEEEEKTGRPTATILCPIRGGKQSAATVDRAIELALSHGARLLFLYIVDVDFLGYATVARVKLMAEELKETGDFALSILCDKARARGVGEVGSLIREGPIRDVIRAVVLETSATHLVTGRPVRMPQTPSFSVSEFDKYLASLREDTGVTIEYVGVDS